MNTWLNLSTATVTTANLTTLFFLYSLNIAFISFNQNMGFTYSNANEYIRYLCNSIRFPIVVFSAAVFHTELPLQLGEFTSSVCFVAMAVLPLAGLHVGEIINKAIMNMVAYILGALLGYGLRTFSQNEIGIVVLLAILFILIALGIFGRSVIKKVKDGYDYVPTAFLMAMFLALVYPHPGWLTKEFDRNIKTLVIAYALTILSVFLLPFFAGDEVHNEVHKNIDTLADIFKDLNEKCFGELMLQNLQDKLFLQKVQSLIDSKEKENSLSKFLSWEVRWHLHPQEQYEKIGDLIHRCALTIRSLSTTVENFHISTRLRDTCKEICSESAKALTLLSDSMKDKTAPKPSIDNHLTAAQDLASGLTKNKLELTATLELTSRPDCTIQYSTAALKLESHPYNKLELTNANVKLASHPENMLELTAVLSLPLEDVIYITSHLVTSVENIKRLASLIKELSDVAPFKQCEQDSNVPKQFIPGIQEMATQAKQLLVAPTENMVSRLFAYLKKLITKCSFASDAPDTIPAPVNLV